MIYGSGIALRLCQYRSRAVLHPGQPRASRTNIFSRDRTKPTTLRFDVVNLFDKIYEIRDGSGIGVFAPQFGPRRGFFVGISQKL